MNRRAFTLLETLLSLTLFILVLALFAGLLQGLRQQRQDLDLNEQVEQLAQVAGETLRRDCQSAHAWITPTLTDLTVHNQAEIDVMEPASWSTRFPAPLPTPLPGTWTLQPAASVLRLRWSVNAGQLLRRCSQGANSEDSVLCQNVSGLRIQHVEGEVLFRLGFQFKQRVLSLDYRVFRRNGT